ncbi:putative serine/threonine-protein kinase PBL28 [Bidens hawaiensis]|uniref:putative serine/threonine-protein kinase PBL28 n=1 Tax=Bidens hawaiensis TaxID=980011 RepID=UPI00404B2A56
MAHMKQFEHLKLRLEALKIATNNFADENCIGRGGFGKVYYGKLFLDSKGETMVALKRLNRSCGQGDPEFWKEIMVLSLYTHDNIVSLLGYCDDRDEKILVYEYVSKRSLDLYLNSKDLSWVRRLKICIGVARGLAYLQSITDIQLRVLHRDIKSSNILLDENWNAKISDFGLSKFGPANKKFTFLISNAVGTFGYCDPLYVETGLLTKESDVYSFGVVLFEVLCGRLCITNNKDERPLVGLVRECYRLNTISDIICNDMKDEINPYSLKEFIKIAYQCLSKAREDRPSMIEVVTALETTFKYQGADGRGGGGMLYVKVLRGRNLKKTNNINPYVILKLNTGTVTSMKKTSVKHMNMNPDWNEEFTLHVEDPKAQFLEIWVQNIASEKLHDIVGMTDVDLSRLTPDKLRVQTHYIQHMGQSQGKIMVELVYKPFEYYTTFDDVCPLQKAPVGVVGLLVVIIHEGTSLERKHHNNPYVSLLFQGDLRKGMLIRNTCDPIWGEEFVFMVEKPPRNDKIHLTVISTPLDELVHPKEECLGYTTISLADVVKKRRIFKYCVLWDSGYETDGELLVELQWRTSD